LILGYAIAGPQANPFDFDRGWWSGAHRIPSYLVNRESFTKRTSTSGIAEPTYRTTVRLMSETSDGEWVHPVFFTALHFYPKSYCIGRALCYIPQSVSPSGTGDFFNNH